MIAIISSMASPGMAFHDSGVAHCDGCHTMHNSEGGDPVATSTNFDLLKYETASDLCLSCHESSYGAVFGQDPLSPPPEMGAGNFVFLLEDNLNDAPNGSANPIDGDAAGHNIIAPSRGVIADGNYVNSPGGNYPSSEMGCTSCHDPHGNSNYRMLYGDGQESAQGYVFSFSAPLATGIELDSGGEAVGNHNAYLGGMSEWCANCHLGYLEDHMETTFEHPTEHDLDSDEGDRYNVYNGDADPDGGQSATAYLPEIPFEDPANSVGSTTGPSSASRIICLSCHRAHASSSPRAGRWDFTASFLAHDGIVSGSHPIPDPYSHPDQQHLCHKCHTPGDDHEEYGPMSSP